MQLGILSVERQWKQPLIPNDTPNDKSNNTFFGAKGLYFFKLSQNLMKLVFPFHGWTTGTQASEVVCLLLDS